MALDTAVRLDHVGIAVRSAGDAAPLLTALDAEFLTEGTVAGRFRWVQYRLGDASRVELVEPLPDAGETFLTDFLDDRGPGLHHVTLEVGDLPAAVGALRDAGFRVVDRRAHDAGWREAFVSPSNPTGTLVQLMEYGPGFAGGDHPPPERLYLGGDRLSTADARSWDVDAPSDADASSDSDASDGAGDPEDTDGPDGADDTDGADGPGDADGGGAPDRSADGAGPDDEASSVPAERRERIAADPFATAVGVELLALGEGSARTRLRISEDLTNFHGTPHGGAVYTLADAAFAAASNARGETAVALEANVSYLEAVEVGTTLEAVAEETHRAGHTAEYLVVVRAVDGPSEDASHDDIPDGADGGDAPGTDDPPAEGRRVATFRGRVYLP